MFVHGGVEPGSIDLHPGVTRQLLGQFHREAVGVVQGEGHVARQHLLAGGERLFQLAQSGPQGAIETGFLTSHRIDNDIVVLHQTGPGRPEHLGRHLDQRRPDGLVDAEPPSRQHRLAHHPAQDVAPPLIGRKHAVTHQHGHGPGVVGHDAQSHVGLRVLAVGDPADGGRLVDDRQEQISVENRVDPLQQRQDPLEAGAGVDVLVGQLGQTPVGRPVQLHEHQVPQFDEALLSAEFGPTIVAVGRPLVDEDLRVRSARADVAHAPEIVHVAHALDPPGRYPHLVDPDLLGLVVALVHRDPEAVTVEAEDLGQQLPGHGDGLFLEVVTEAEIAQHLEEGAVVGVRADDVDIGRAEALLDAGGPGPGCHLVAHEVGLERDHARDGEQDRRVVGNQAGRGNRHVPPVGEVAREGRPQFIGVH